MTDHHCQPPDVADERRVAFAMLARAAQRHPSRVHALVTGHNDITAAAAELESTTWAGGVGLRETVREDLALAAENGARLITRDDEEWPHQQFTALGTAGVGAAPLALWARGPAALSTFTARAVAVVGTRSATSYGHHVAEEFTEDLVRRGYPIMTAADGGIATAAHRRALSEQVPALAVTTSGIAAAASGAEAALLDQTARHGLVLSLHAPYSITSPDAVLSRNELIAALTRAVLVAQTPATGQTHQLVASARRLHRPIFAVPGPITTTEHGGCHALIRRGEATLVTHPGQIHGFLGHDTTPRNHP